MNNKFSQSRPLPLMTSETGSFAQKTIVERKPQIIKRVIADNGYPAVIDKALHKFAREIDGQTVAPLRSKADDRAMWDENWAKIEGLTWLEIPWYFAETYFYRRLLEITGYFQPGPFYRRDPFEAQKVQQEHIALEQLEENLPVIPQSPSDDRFTALLHTALWGNRADLSNFTVKESAHQGKLTHILRQHIIINHTQEVYDLVSQGLNKVAFINDNVGADSVSDLLLADFLLTHNWAQTVVFHLKHQPFFVSDALPEDLHRVIRKMNTKEGPIQDLGERLADWLENGRLQFEEDPFWVSCLTFLQLPGHLHDNLAQADLVILKGDVNYRRLLDDRHWHPTTTVESIAVDFPKPFLILRTLKGEIIAGLAEGQAQAIAAKDPTWLINGKRGIIQMVQA